MEIRECLSVYLESGYLFDDMSGRLKWFEIDKILISFTYGVVRYVGTWGGCRTEKTLDGKLFYSSEECFKKGESIPKTRLSIYEYKNCVTNSGIKYLNIGEKIPES